jgi:WD40 repeat protein
MLRSSARIVLALALTPFAVNAQPADPFPPVPKTVDKDAPFLTLQNGEAEVTCLAFTPDGKRLATGDDKGIVRLCEFPGGKELLRIEEKQAVRYLAFPTDGKSLVTVHRSADGKRTVVRVRDLDTCKLNSSFSWPEGSVHEITLSPDGKTLATADFDKTVRIWDIKTGKATKELKLEENSIRICYPSGGETLFIVTQHQHCLLAWDLQDDKSERLLNHTKTVPGATDGIWIVGSTRKGKLISSDGSGSLIIWERNHDKWIASLQLYDISAPEGLSEDGYNLASYSFRSETVELLELGTGKVRLSWGDKSARFREYPFSPDGRYIAIPEGKTVKILKVTAPDTDRIDVSKLTPSEFAALWDDLSSEDGKAAFRAVCLLTNAPKRTLPMIKERLNLAVILETGAVEKRVPELIAALDDDQFESREKASYELAIYGRLAETALKQASESKSVEVRRRAKILLGHLEDDPKYTEYLRALRAAEVLSRIDSPEARALLKPVRSTRRSLMN